MTSALHRFLVEFDSGLHVPAATPAWQALDRPSPCLVVVPDEDGPAPLPERDAVGEAVAAALAQAETRHAAAVAAAEARFAAELAEARARWVAEEGQALVEAFRRAAAEAEDRLAEAAGAVLEPFVMDAVRRAAVEELRGALADLVGGGAGGRIAVSGPEDLLDALRGALGRAGMGAGTIDFAVTDLAEVEITADSSAVRTRLADWALAFRRRLESEA